MSFISRIGRKIGSVGRAGGKLLSKFGKIGTKVTGGLNKVMDTVERIPLVGSQIKENRVYQGMRGIVSGASKVSSMASKAGQILEATPGTLHGAYQTAGQLKHLGKAGRGKRNDIVGGANVSGQNTLAAVAAGHKQKDMGSRTNSGATGNVSHGSESIHKSQSMFD